MNLNRFVILLIAEVPVAVGLAAFAQAQGYPIWVLALLCLLFGGGVGVVTYKWVRR